LIRNLNKAEKFPTRPNQFNQLTYIPKNEIHSSKHILTLGLFHKQISHLHKEFQEYNFKQLIIASYGYKKRKPIHLYEGWAILPFHI